VALATGLTVTLVLSMVSGAVARRDQEDPAVTYCSSLTELATSIESLASMSTSSTVDEFKAGVEQVKEASAATKESIEGLVEAQVAALQTAVDDLKGYTDSLSGDETMEQAMQGAVDQMAAVASARDAVGTLPNCALVLGEQAAPSPAP
jgi:hypothetical protein